jgi:halogenation protein CepH
MIAPVLEPDVVIGGGGLAGLAGAVHLRRQGLRVVCVEPTDGPTAAVGESFDFSTVALLEELGLPFDLLRASGAGHPKDLVQLVVPGSDPETVWPAPWFARWPVRCSMQALHGDRHRLDRLVAGLAHAEGVEMLRDRVTRVRTSGDAVEAFDTARGQTVRARWFVDASGHSTRLLARAFGLERTDQGPPKMAYWARIQAPPRADATIFHVTDPGAEYLAWTWEIPLSDSEISVGHVLPVEAARRRSVGRDPSAVFAELVEASPGLDRVAGRATGPVQLTSFSPHVHRPAIGPNWVIVGDAGALADPLTSNGVTAALRQARLAAGLIAEAGSPPFTRSQRTVYRITAETLPDGLNAAVERLVYEGGVRRRFGLRAAVVLYAGFGIVTNSRYALAPRRTLARALSFAPLPALGRAWGRAWSGGAQAGNRWPTRSSLRAHNRSAVASSSR